jgi:tetratricopeptide (TPR) repeat protein
MSDPGDSTLARLRHQAEKALERSDRPGTVVAILDRIVELADEGSEPAIFAHRHLAELRLEKHPWRAALHLRKVISAHPNDDVTHALMGLCQALLGNYRAAISAYYRALQTAPGTPWYHHNLGHLLDVALGEPVRAEPYLRKAHQLEPHHDEIVASLAHCLARLDKSEEAESLARRAVKLSPKSRDHRDLLKWIQEGDEPIGASADDDGIDDDDDADADAVTSVRERFDTLMTEAGFTEGQRACAHRLWSDFCAGRRLRVQKPGVYAAAVEYAIALLHRRKGVTQASVAKRYGIAATSLSSRYGEMREALDLRPNDPRYAVGI